MTADWAILFTIWATFSFEQETTTKRPKWRWKMKHIFE